VSDAAAVPERARDDWFVVWTESRAEKKVRSRLAALGMEPWLPMVTERHRWSDRWHEVEAPLFPGYLFARPAAVWPAVLRAPGVITVVKSGRKPAGLSDGFIRELRQAITRGRDAMTALPATARFEPGDEVVVQEGPFRGVRGVVREMRGQRELVIWVRVIGRGLACRIGSALVAPARGQQHIRADDD
jgi:transcription antitermination factor NusG